MRLAAQIAIRERSVAMDPVRTAIDWVLTLCLCVSLCGCAALLETEGYEKTLYAEPTAPVPTVDSGSVSSYAQLLAAIGGMVQDHTEETTLLFRNYEGDIPADLAAACREMQYEDALGAYALDYISYDVHRIVSYYEVELFLRFRRTKAQTDGIVSLSGTTAVRERLTQAMAAGENYLVLHSPATTLTATALQAMALECYRQNPGEILLLPEMEIRVYPERGIERVFELSLDYGCTTEELTARHTRLADAVDMRLEQVLASGGELSRLAFDLARETRLVPAGTEDSSTAYSALVNGAADSQGLAMAFAALCSAGGLEAQVVEGSYGGEVCWWNLVHLGEQHWAHCDIAALSAGSPGAFLASDSAMAAQYIWDNTRYPAANGPGEIGVPLLNPSKKTEISS